MVTSLQLKRYLCCSLRVTTLVTLWYSLIISFVGYYLLFIEAAVSYGHNISDILSPRLLLTIMHFLPYHLLIFAFATGLCGTHLRKPSFLMVTILGVFVITGFNLNTVLQRIAHIEIVGVGSIIPTLVFQLVISVFGLMWYNYFLELKQQLDLPQTKHVIINST